MTVLCVRSCSKEMSCFCRGAEYPKSGMNAPSPLHVLCVRSRSREMSRFCRGAENQREFRALARLLFLRFCLPFLTPIGAYMRGRGVASYSGVFVVLIAKIGICLLFLRNSLLFFKLSLFVLTLSLFFIRFSLLLLQGFYH